MTINFLLPYPPSANAYYRTVRGRPILSKAAREYRAEICSIIGQCATMEGRLIVAINVYPPDRRKRDIDNLVKQTLDALQHAGVYGDDSQIDKLSITRREIVKGGSMEIGVETLGS